MFIIVTKKHKAHGTVFPGALCNCVSTKYGIYTTSAGTHYSISFRPNCLFGYSTEYLCRPPHDLLCCRAQQPKRLAKPFIGGVPLVNITP